MSGRPRTLPLSGVRAPNDKALSVLFAGFVYEDRPRPWGCTVSNFEWNPSRIPGDTFTLTGWRAKHPGDGNPAGVFMAGMTAGVNDEQRRSLLALLEQNAAPATLIGKAVQLVRDAAESQASADLIGSQCTSIVLPANPAEQPSMQYHSAAVTHAIHGASLVVARGPDESAVFAEPETVVTEASGGPPLALGPKIGRNKPCWCGSQRKFKKCHGA